MSQTQKLAFGVGSIAFGQEAMMDSRERLLRFFEEAVELVRAGGLTLNDVQNVVTYEFSRDIGVVTQEIAGTAVTLYAVASAFGVDLEEVAGNECHRVLENLEKIRAKQKAKPDHVKSARVAA